MNELFELNREIRVGASDEKITTGAEVEHARPLLARKRLKRISELANTGSQDRVKPPGRAERKFLSAFASL